MKLIRNIGLLSIILFSTSCESFLEVEDVGRTSIPIFFSDMEGIRAAVPGAYSKVYEYYDSNFILYPDVAGDLLNLNAVGEDVKMFQQFNYMSTPQDETTAVGHIWRDAYEALANVNNILEYQPALLAKFPENKTELKRIKAESLFLRALIHFDLVRVYAQPYNFTEDASHVGIPVLVTLPGPDENPPRNSVAETYDQILQDLAQAEILFQDIPKTDSYHASGQAVKALFARVFLYMEDWQMAKEYATMVIASSQLAEGSDYIDMFRTLGAGKEAIFRLNGNLKTSTVAEFYTPSNPTAYASRKLIDMFDGEPDLRLELIETKANIHSTLKYSLPGLIGDERQIDLFVLRTSEMYLIRAEANAQLNFLEEAVSDIKTLRTRALQVPISEIVLPSLTKESLLDLIFEERAKELSFEGHRLFDITRTKRNLQRYEDVNSSVKSIAYPSYLFVLPIPETEMDANSNMVQNENYN